MSKIGILGTGTWGTALGRMLVNTGHSVVMWSAIEKEIDNLSSIHIHPNLPGMTIPQKVQFTKIPNDQIMVDVGKGIETDTL